MPQDKEFAERAQFVKEQNDLQLDIDIVWETLAELGLDCDSPKADRVKEALDNITTALGLEA